MDAGLQFPGQVYVSDCGHASAPSAALGFSEVNKEIWGGGDIEQKTNTSVKGGRG